MSDQREQNPASDTSSSWDYFKAGVEALVELRDSGSAMLFLPRQNTVRLIGDFSEFVPLFSKKLAGEKPSPAQRAIDALGEVVRYVDIVLTWPDHSARAKYLGSRLVYTPPSDEGIGIYHLSTGLSREQAKGQEDRATLVAGALCSESLRRRNERLGVAFGACLADVDVDFVAERHDPMQGTTVADPFLRVRLNYTDGSGPSPSIGWPGVVADASAKSRSFEFEADESDIDLLVLRLTAAKQRLAELREEKRGGD